MFGDLLSRPFWGVVRGCLERRIGAAVRETDAESEGREGVMCCVAVGSRCRAGEIGSVLKILFCRLKK